MKGLSQTLQLVVAAVVVLIIALVLLTIFGGGIQQVVDFSQAQNFCGTEGATSCMGTGVLPVDWTIIKHNVKDMGLMSCKMVYDEITGGCSTCEECGFTA